MTARMLAVAAGVLLSGCSHDPLPSRQLHEQAVVLRREVEGLRVVVQRLERGEPMLPLDDVSVAIDDTLVRDLIGAQLPLDIDVSRYHLTLTEVAVQFRGSPVVRLSGRLQVREQPSLSAVVTLVGALDRIAVDDGSSMLSAHVSADHLEIHEAVGLAQYLSDELLDDIGRLIRLEIADQLPTFQIPITVRQHIDFAAVTDGPVRIAGSRLPLEVAVSQVTAARGRLWISVRITPGAFVKLTDAPAAGDASASAAGISFALDGPTPPAPRPARQERRR
ncbi:MAG: hypothetical protein ABI880_09380 [Acidobacteriota bacterium]